MHQREVMSDLMALRQLLNNGDPSSSEGGSRSIGPDAGQAESNVGEETATNSSSNSSDQLADSPSSQEGGASPATPADDMQTPAATDRSTFRPWGELPPRVLDAMLQATPSDFLPGYEEVTRDYYRRLAEPTNFDSRPDAQYQLE
jgi:hypothetical protein